MLSLLQDDRHSGQSEENRHDDQQDAQKDVDRQNDGDCKGYDDNGKDYENYAECFSC